MNISTEIIEVLDNLCQKFGIVIDWTSDNIFPYIQEIFRKIVNYELSTSIIWIIASGIFATILIFYANKCFKKGKVFNDIANADEDNWKARYDAEEWYAIGIFLLFISLIWICVIIVQTFDIVTCFTFPEKLIFDYIKSYISQGG